MHNEEKYFFSLRFFVSFFEGNFKRKRTMRADVIALFQLNSKNCDLKLIMDDRKGMPKKKTGLHIYFREKVWVFS